MFTLWLPFLLVGIVIDAVFIVLEYQKKPVPAVIAKGLASLMFVVVGLICFAQTKDRTFGLLIVIGLIFGALGDVLLNLRAVLVSIKSQIFAAGIAVFMIGHILYIAALGTRDPLGLVIALPVAAVLCLALIPFTLKRIEAPAKLRAFGTVYLAVVVLMFACAAVLLVRHPDEMALRLFAPGALLFMVSDFVLVFYLFGKTQHKAFRAINLSLYYIGQLLIALCLLFA